ncbi:MAG: hypothetical protein ACREMR_00830, partial [Gemmatimonadales bacterium]
AATAGPVGAQVRADAQLLAALTRVDPVPGARPLSELRVVQPVVMVRAVGSHLAFQGTVSVEGATMPNGELTLGAWGEGFVDRRHPHTYAHELMVTASSAPGVGRGALSAGKGFVAFGTDDPMSRPPLRYPVNHHYSQILERAVVIAALGAGPLTVEGSLFNGDEPERPDQWPNLERFGDSWAGRLTIVPLAGLEGQVSRAHVASPEHRDGAGPAHEQWSASMRWHRPSARLAPYALAEWARTETSEGFFVFHSILAEAAVRLGRHQVYARFEQTERPEEQRVSDFRTRRPPIDDSLLGTTRWSISTLGGAVGIGGIADAIDIATVLEASYGRVTTVGGGVFDPEVYYGRSDFLSLTLALRARLGFEGHRMGRYGFPEAGHHH